MATACACLIGGEAIATQFLRPIRGEETMSRAGHGVLVYARSGCENAADDIGFVTGGGRDDKNRSEEHTSELQSLMRISYAVFCLKKKTYKKHTTKTTCQLQ